MRRLLSAALVIALLVGAFVGVASARLAVDHSGSPVRRAAPMRAPVAMPRPERTQPGAYSFRSAASIVASMEGPSTGAGGGERREAGAASASVTVTATVLPVVMLVVDPDTGELRELFTNTPQRRATGVLYLVREGAPDGERGAMTPALWRAARAGLADAGAGTGTIWPR